MGREESHWREEDQVAAELSGKRWWRRRELGLERWLLWWVRRWRSREDWERKVPVPERLWWVHESQCWQKNSGQAAEAEGGRSEGRAVRWDEARWARRQEVNSVFSLWADIEEAVGMSEG